MGFFLKSKSKKDQIPKSPINQFSALFLKSYHKKHEI